MSRSVPIEDLEDSWQTLLDEVKQNLMTFVITRDGKPVAQLGPPEEPKSLVGTVTQLVSDEEFIKPLYDDWEPDWPE